MSSKNNIFFRRVDEDLPVPLSTGLLIFILSIGGTLRFFRLGVQSFWTDEVAGIIMSDRSLVEVIGVTLLRDLNPPLGYISLHFWQLLGGSSEIWMRALPALLGVASIILIFLFASRQFGNRVGLLAALLLATSPFAVYLSQEVRYYNLALVLSLFNLIQLLALEKNPESRSVEGRFILGWWLGWLTHYYFFLLYAACFLYFMLAHRQSNSHRRRFLFLSFKSALYYSPWFLVILYQFRQQTYKFRPDISIFGGLFDIATYFTYGHSDRMLPGMLPWLDELSRNSFAFTAGFLLLGLPFLIALLGNFLSGRKDTSRYIALNLSVLLVPLAISLVVSLLGIPLFRYFYFILFFPAFLILTARGFRLLHLRKTATFYFLIILLLALHSSSLYSYYTDSRYHREDWRGLVSHIQSNWQPGDVVITYSVDSSGAFLFYAGKEFWQENVQQVLTTHTLYFEQQPKELLEKRLVLFHDKYKRFWFLRHYGYMFEPEGVVRAFFDSGEMVLIEELNDTYRIDAGLYANDREGLFADQALQLQSMISFNESYPPLQVGPGFLSGSDSPEWVWLSPKASVWLPPPTVNEKLFVECLLPVQFNEPPVELKVFVGEMEIAGFTLSDKEIRQFTIPIPENSISGDIVRVTLHTNKSFRPSPLQEERSILVRKIGWVD